MNEKLPEKLDYDHLEAGQEFPPIQYTLEPEVVDKFLEAVEEGNALYREEPLVPPMAVAARAMAALASCVTVPPGSIHVSQELEFLGRVTKGEKIKCVAKVLRKQERARLRILHIGIDVSDSAGNQILISRTSFMLPGQE